MIRESWVETELIRDLREIIMARAGGDSFKTERYLCLDCFGDRDGCITCLGDGYVGVGTSLARSMYYLCRHSIQDNGREFVTLSDVIRCCPKCAKWSVTLSQLGHKPRSTDLYRRDIDYGIPLTPKQERLAIAVEDSFVDCFKLYRDRISFDPEIAVDWRRIAVPYVMQKALLTRAKPAVLPNITF